MMHIDKINGLRRMFQQNVHKARHLHNLRTVGMLISDQFLLEVIQKCDTCEPAIIALFSDNSVGADKGRSCSGGSKVKRVLSFQLIPIYCLTPIKSINSFFSDRNCCIHVVWMGNVSTSLNQNNWQTLRFAQCTKIRSAFFMAIRYFA